MKKVIPILLGVLGVLVLSGYVYFFKIRPAREYDPTVRGSGSIEATEVVVSAKIPARIVSLEVQEGDEVEVGQEVAHLDCTELRVRHAQAEAQLAQAKAVKLQAEAAARQARGQTEPLRVQRAFAAKEHERAVRLFASAAVPQRTVDQAETTFRSVEEQLRAAELGVKLAESAVGVAAAQIKLAEKTLALADTQTTECTLVAPIDGTVLTKNREMGELVLPGASLVKLGSLDSVFTWIFVPNREVGRVQLGQLVKLEADTYPGREFVGTVGHINDQAEFTPKSIQTKEDRTRLVFGVKVNIPNPDHALMPGMPVEAELVASSDDSPAGEGS